MIKSAGRNSESLLLLTECPKDIFETFVTNDPGDRFAKTFIAKANMQGIWGRCVGLYKDDELVGAQITTVSKREPKVANLQLLHVFNRHRGRGYGRDLMKSSLNISKNEGATYYRVSSEPTAVKFYESIGIKFWGLQKSGCSLAMFKLDADDFASCTYDDRDPVIRSALYSGRKGSLASSYKNKDDTQTIL